MNRNLTHLILALVLSLAYTPLAQAQDAPAPEPIADETAPIAPSDATAPSAEAAETMTPEQQAMMANMQAYSTPNENHELLAGLAGKWSVKVTHWMKPGTEGEVSMGSMTSAMIMGGRFLEQNFSGSMMEQPFEGKGLYGYDNIQKKFNTVWYDNIGTGIMSTGGSYDTATKKLTEEGTMSCPMTNGERWYRAETTLTDNDHYTYETYMKDEAGAEFRSMLIEYSREI